MFSKLFVIFLLIQQNNHYRSMLYDQKSSGQTPHATLMAVFGKDFSCFKAKNKLYFSTSLKIKQTYTIVLMNF